MPKRPPAQARVASSTRGLWKQQTAPQQEPIPEMSQALSRSPNCRSRSGSELADAAPSSGNLEQPSGCLTKEDIPAPAQHRREDAGDCAEVDLDAILEDIGKLDEVSFSRRPHDHVDWRKVMQLRLKSQVFDPSKNQDSFLTWKQLANYFGLKASWLYKHCQDELAAATKRNHGKAFDLASEPLKLRGKKQIPRRQVKQITSTEMLQNQSHLSLGQRCSELKRRFGLDLKPHQLRSIYRQESVKRKKVETKPPRPQAHLEKKRAKERRDLKKAMEECFRKKIPIYWHDECVFKSKDFKRLAFSRPKENVLVDFQRAPPALAVSGIMNETGLCFFLTKKKSIHEDDHVDVIYKFRRSLGHRRRVALFYDGLWIHKGKKAQAALRANNILPMLNVAYNSPMNPIEQIWGAAKKIYRIQLLEYLCHNEAKDLRLKDFVCRILEGPLGLDYAAVIAKCQQQLVELLGINIPN